MPPWTILTDKRNHIENQPVHQHERDLVFGVEYADQPGIIECPRCGERKPKDAKTTDDNPKKR